MIGGFAALHYWFPKLCGRLLGEGLGKVALLLMFVGLNVYVLAMAPRGSGQPVDVYSTTRTRASTATTWSHRSARSSS